jgi:hypothetical protein
MRYRYTMAAVPTICFLIVVMALILILSTLTSVQSFQDSGTVHDVFVSQYAPVDHYTDPEDPEELPVDMALPTDDGELVDDGATYEAFEGGELHAFSADEGQAADPSMEHTDPSM